MLKRMKQLAPNIIAITLAGAAAFTSLPVSAAPETVAGGYVIDMERLPKVHFPNTRIGKRCIRLPGTAIKAILRRLQRL